MKRYFCVIIILFLLISCSSKVQVPDKTETVGKPEIKQTEEDIENPEKVKKTVFSQSDYNDFISSVREGDSSEVIKAVEKGIDVKQKDESGNTALHWAAGRGELSLVKLFVKKGVDVNAVDGYRAEPVIMWATKKGQKDVVECLVEKGADINLSDKYGETALMDAARYGHYEMVEFLVHNRANVNDRSVTGESALMYASSNGHENIVEFLVNNGANINFVNYRTSETALAKAKNRGHKKIVNIIRRQAATEGKLIKRPEKPEDKGFVNEPPGEEELYAAWGGRENSLPSTLSSRYINMHMKRLLPRITKCYQKRYEQGDRNMMGTVEMEFRIAGNGEIVDVYFTTEKYQSSLFGDCILEVVKSKKFPMFYQGVLLFKYQYTF
ncbi:MAG: ankyrin repeat domain-containing protein [bacterium]